MQGLPKSLFITFIFSTILAIAINSIYYAIIQHIALNDYQQAVPRIAGAVFFLTLMLTIMSLPSLFLSNINYWSNLLVRLLLYFSGSVVFLITISTMPLSPVNKLFDVITGIVFISIHTVFYFIKVKKG